MQNNVLLHGTLLVNVYEVSRLSGPGCSRCFCKGLEKIEETIKCGKASCKLYATIDLDGTRVARTRLVDHARSDPQWNESFYIYCAHTAANVVISIKENNAIGAALIGRAYLPTTDVINGQEVNRWLKVKNRNDRPLRRGTKVHVSVRFYDAKEKHDWSKGINVSRFRGVPYTFFTERSGCRVTLYQDAHVPDKFVPKIPLSGGRFYELNRCWEDLFDAIMNAKHLIYIVGWSVFTKITLIRDLRRPKPGGDMILGEILKKKAEEGVRVLMLVWDDRTSVKLLKKDGVMATHDEDTRSYFHNTKVHCILCPRKPDNSESFVQGIEISTLFTHHQKAVVVDSQLPNGDAKRRRIVGFLGGIDLCDGRYDTQFHSLFRTLATAHRNDFHQPSILGASIDKGGPREPWHDLYCKLEGPVAWDVLFNFEQRWRKQGEEDLLVDITGLGDTFIPPSLVLFPGDNETWNVQIFRSIDGGAVSGFPDSPKEAATAGLVSWKNNVVDRSIQDAYINAIRRAKNFIYIENQYFIGSCFSWKSNDINVKEVGALNLIPKELSLKIVSKIEAGQRFTAYIVLPMWPEGIPESGSVQAILNWQKRTIEMMYNDIGKAILSKGIAAHPKDYLSFFCLGNREAQKPGEFVPSETPEHNSDYSRAQQSRRFMIYVHAKMMIVDDEYIIIGSANINQRSMDGARDTEIAMGGYQPFHLSTNRPAKGQIHGFRMSLWYEHTGMLHDSFYKPESLECIRKFNQIGSEYWDLYSCEKLDSDLPGHLLAYPIGVAGNGEISELPENEHFPDTRARVFGSKSDILPAILTT